MASKFTFRQFQALYPDDDACPNCCLCVGSAPSLGALAARCLGALLTGAGLLAFAFFIFILCDGAFDFSHLNFHPVFKILKAVRAHLLRPLQNNYSLIH